MGPTERFDKFQSEYLKISSIRFSDFVNQPAHPWPKERMAGPVISKSVLLLER